jgi:hypothetical protein
LIDLVTILSDHTLPGTESTTGVRMFASSRSGNRVQGVVEVLFDSRWGLVCQPFSEEAVIRAVCGEFGYSTSSGELFGAE